MIEEDNKRQPEYPKPDVEQMLPFKPKAVVCKTIFEFLLMSLQANIKTIAIYINDTENYLKHYLKKNGFGKKD